MANAYSSVKVRMLATDVYVGDEVTQIQKIKTVADVAGSLDGKAFLYVDVARTRRAVYLSKDSSTIAPSLPGWTLTKVSYASGATAAAIATAIANALTLITGTTATAAGNEVTLSFSTTGFAPLARDYTEVPASMTGFSFSVITLGDKEELVGLLDGDIEIGGFGVDSQDVKAHQTGSTLLAKIITGVKNPEISYTLMETDKDTIMRAFRASGFNSFMPIGPDAVESFGYGTSLIGGAKPRRKLRLHTIADNADRSQDWNFWACEADLDKFTRTSEKVSTFPIKLTAYQDTTKPKVFDIFFCGDTRTLTLA